MRWALSQGNKHGEVGNPPIRDDSALGVHYTNFNTRQAAERLGLFLWRLQGRRNDSSYRIGRRDSRLPLYRATKPSCT
jgi:hypothetical protein